MQLESISQKSIPLLLLIESEISVAKKLNTKIPENKGKDTKKWTWFQETETEIRYDFASTNFSSILMRELEPSSMDFIVGRWNRY